MSEVVDMTNCKIGQMNKQEAKADAGKPKLSLVPKGIETVTAKLEEGR